MDDNSRDGSGDDDVDGVLDDGVSIVKAESNSLEAITRSEISMQLEAAHRFPRSTTRFLRDATSLATLTREVAESCMYTLPRGKKQITGPSVRLAEIIASTWGNLQVAARVVGLDPDETVVIAQGVAWDMQRNLRLTVEAHRSILRSDGRTRYDADMIRVTGAAAMAIARRNVVFQVVPRSYVDAIYGAARACAVGDAKTLATRREEWLGRLGRMGVSTDRVFARLGIRGMEDISLDHGATLIGLANAIKKGEVDVDEAFPPAALGGAGAPSGAAPSGAAPSGASPSGASPAAAAQAAPEGRRVNVGTGKRGRAAAAAGESSGAPPKAGPPPPPPPAAAAAPAAAPEPVVAEGAGVVDAAALVLALALVDDAWKTPRGREIVDGWSESERGEAYRWTQAVLGDAPIGEQLARPPFTNIDGPDDGAEGAAP